MNLPEIWLNPVWDPPAAGGPRPGGSQDPKIASQPAISEDRIPHFRWARRSVPVRARRSVPVRTFVGCRLLRMTTPIETRCCCLPVAQNAASYNVASRGSDVVGRWAVVLYVEYVSKTY